MWISTGIESLWQDLCYAARSLRKNPGFAAVVVFSLALGIGANSTIFSVLNAVIYRPLPFDQPDRLMMIWESEFGNKIQPPVSEIVDWNRQNDVFEDIASSSFTESAPLGGGQGPAEQVQTQFVSPNFFSVLRVKPLLGRVFLTSEIHDETQTVVISHALWQRRFGGDPKVLGKTFTVSGVLSTVVGVMPQGFAPFYGEKIDLWYPIDPAGDRYSKRDDRGWLFAFGRLKPGVTRDQAQSGMAMVARRLERMYPKNNKGVGVLVEPLHRALFSWAGGALYPVAAAVAFVLLIACANVANLLLSRMETRRKEHAVRASLGAGRRRLMQQVLAESGLLALLGSALGVVLTYGGIWLFRVVVAGELDFPNSRTTSVDGNVLLFTLAACLLTALLSGAVPALIASRPDLNLALREGEHRVSSAGRGRIRQALAVAETALAVVLLAGAGLMIHSLLHLMQVHPGFDPHNVMIAELSVPEGGKYLDRVPGGSMEKTSPLVNAFYQQLLDNLEASPGVESAGMISSLLGSEGRTFSVLGRPATLPEKMPGAGYQEVSPSLFRALRVPLKAGRFFDAHDTYSSPWVAVINEAFARRYFPNENPIGKRLLLRYGGYGVDEPQPRQIVGVVGDVKHSGLARKVPEMIYAVYLQQPAAFPGGTVLSHLSHTLVLRSRSPLTGHQEQLASALKKLVAKLDPDLPLTDITTADRVLASSVAVSRFYLRLLGTFAAIAVLLAAIGIYGVMAYFVRERTREIGIRIALGAQRKNVLAMIAHLGLKLTLLGVFIGLVLALGLTRLVASLFAVNTSDPATLLGVASGLLLVALLACYFPARRATKVDPMVTLRYE